MHSQPFNFDIQSASPVSGHFLDEGIRNFHQAALFIRDLPYGRNADKKNLTTVFTDGCGTCSTKHALLKLLCEENNFADVKLILCLFRMSASTTPEIARTLAKYNLSYIPEAHNYLRYGGQILDFTKPGFPIPDFEDHLIEEIEIEPDQITDFKVSYHKNYIDTWLSQNPETPYSPAELWAIREECIQDLSA